MLYINNKNNFLSYTELCFDYRTICENVKTAKLSACIRGRALPSTSRSTGKADPESFMKTRTF